MPKKAVLEHVKSWFEELMKAEPLDSFIGTYPELAPTYQRLLANMQSSPLQFMVLTYIKKGTTYSDLMSEIPISPSYSVLSEIVVSLISDGLVEEGEPKKNPDGTDFKTFKRTELGDNICDALMPFQSVVLKREILRLKEEIKKRDEIIEALKKELEKLRKNKNDITKIKR